jgi:hypothetical protein
MCGTTARNSQQFVDFHGLLRPVLLRAAQQLPAIRLAHSDRRGDLRVLEGEDFLQHILRIGDAAQHAVGDGEEQSAVLLEDGKAIHVPVHHLREKTGEGETL